MLHVPTLRVSTQPVYVAGGCVHSQFTQNHANVTETPAKSVNRCRKSLVRKELYLQTGFTDGLHSWLGLRWYLMQLQRMQRVGKKPTQSSLRPPCVSVNRCTCFELPAVVSPYAKSRLRYLTPAQAIYRRLQIYKWGVRPAIRVCSLTIRRGVRAGVPSRSRGGTAPRPGRGTSRPRQWLPRPPRQRR